MVVFAWIAGNPAAVPNSDGVVTVEAQKVKRLRGMALYLPVVLKTVFLSFKAPRVTIEQACWNAVADEAQAFSILMTGILPVV